MKVFGFAALIQNLARKTFPIRETIEATSTRDINGINIFIHCEHFEFDILFTILCLKKKLETITLRQTSVALCDNMISL